MEIGALGGMSQGFSMEGMRPPGGMRRGGDPSQHAEEMSSKILDEQDTDGDGLLSSEELGSSFSSDILAALDSDEDGLLSQEELQTGIRSKMEEAKAGFESGTEPTAENKEFMQMMHSLSGTEMPQRPDKAKASQAYSLMQESMFGGSQQAASYNTDQLLLESLNLAV